MDSEDEIYVEEKVRKRDRPYFIFKDDVNANNEDYDVRNTVGEESS